VVFYFKNRGGKKDKLLKVVKGATKEDQEIGEGKGGVTSV